MSCSINLRIATGIYSITHKKSGKRYIGSTYCNFYDRWCAHRSTLQRKIHSSILLRRAWDKYSEEDSEFEVIEIGNVDLDKRELHFINLHKSYLPKHGYNISKETNNARLGHQQSKKTRKAISKKLKGIKRSDKTIKRMSESKVGENNPMYGKIHSKEYIEKRVKNNRKQVIRDDGKIYSSLKEAAIDIGALQQSVSASVRLGYKVKGWRFTYVTT